MNVGDLVKIELNGVDELCLVLEVIRGTSSGHQTKCLRLHLFSGKEYLPEFFPADFTNVFGSSYVKLVCAS